MKRVLILAVALLLSACNPHAQKGELYQCFKDGKRVYASNESPSQRGGVWFADQKTGETFQADGCYCMGCVGF